MKLNIYGKKNGRKTVVKTYEAPTYAISYGIVEDIIQLINIDDFNELTDDGLKLMIGKIVVSCMPTIRELLLDIFDGLTEEELRSATVPEIIQVIIEVFNYTISLIGMAGGDEKNRPSR